MVHFMCVLSRFSRVRLFVTPWTIACQAPLSKRFSRQEHWSGLLCPSPGDLPDPGIKPVSLTIPAFVGGFFIANATWVHLKMEYYLAIKKKKLIQITTWMGLRCYTELFKKANSQNLHTGKKIDEIQVGL